MFLTLMLILQFLKIMATNKTWIKVALTALKYIITLALGALGGSQLPEVLG